MEVVKWKAGNTIMWVRAGVGAHADEGGGGKMDAASHTEEVVCLRSFSKSTPIRELVSFGISLRTLSCRG